MPPIITVTGLSKRYRIIKRRHGRDWLVNDLRRGVARLARRVTQRRGGPPPEARHDDVWALRDVSFDVARGEVLGLVGHNGAGKTTLLKVLSRITTPTAGRAVLRGRLNSLIEVGVGFHPELTGRENIFLKGAIHGLGRDDIKRHFDAIVAFAEVERFLDTPMKRYSDGMRSRLGFAIGAWLEHEILVVDEVLAVGDARFRAEAMARIRAAARERGTTTIFVSHDLGQIRELCPRSVLLEGGRLVADGPTADVLDRYLAPTPIDALPATWERAPTDRGHLRRVRLVGPAGAPTAAFRVGDTVRVELLADRVDTFSDLDAHVTVDTVGGQRLLRFRSSMVGLDLGATGAPTLCVTAIIDELPLAPGQYTLSVALARGRGLIAQVDRALRFEVLAADPWGAGDAWTPGDGPTWARGRWERGPATPDDPADPREQA